MVRSTLQLPPQDHQLMSKHRVLGRDLDLNGEARTARATHRAARSFRQRRRFHRVINSDKGFGTHSPGSACCMVEASAMSQRIVHPPVSM